MLEEVKKVLAGIRKDTEKVIRRLTENHLRCERYDVTTAPNGTVIGVTQPFGTEELLIPYSWMCSNAQVGDTVIVVWWSGLSNAQAWFMGDGWVSRLLSITSGGGGITVNGTLSTTGNATIGGNLSVSGNENVNGNFTVLGNAMGRVLGLGQARASIPANADLNDYVEPGVYGIVSNAIASTLTNRPSTNAGTLRVWNSFGDGKNAGSTWFGITQEYCDYVGNTWKRHGDSSSDPAIIWSAWVAQQNVSSSDYCKMPDGTLICWGETTYDLSGGTVNSGSGYWYVEKAQTIAFPVAFVSRPSVIVTKGAGSITVPGWVGWNNQGITEIDWIYWTSSPSLTNKPIACWQAIGRWK